MSWRFPILTVPIFIASCRAHEARVDCDDSFSRSERNAIQDIADRTVLDVRRVLPALPRSLTLRVRPGTNVIRETGEGASATPPDFLPWTVDPSRGVMATITDAASSDARSRIPSLGSRRSGTTQFTHGRGRQ